jgi:hypothetical protein
LFVEPEADLKDEVELDLKVEVETGRWDEPTEDEDVLLKFICLKEIKNLSLKCFFRLN